MRLIVLLALVALLPLRADAQVGQVTVGVDPAFWDNAVIGMQWWNDTGYVAFVPVEGCGAGEVNICSASNLSAYPDARAGWVVGTNTIEIYDGSVGPGVYCHELGHWLGLRWFADETVYHRSDYLSCMSNPYSPDLPPDDIDLANLGYVRPEPVWQLHDGTGGPSMPLYP